MGQRYKFVAVLFLTAALLFNTVPARADHEHDEHLQEAQFLLKVHTILAEMQEQLGHEEATGKLTDTRLAASLQLYASKMIDAYTPHEKKPLLQKIKPMVLAKVAWGTLAGHVKEAAKTVSKTAREKGVAVAAGVGLGIALDPVMLALLPAVGAPAWMIGVSLATPYPIILPSLISKAQEMVVQQRVKNLYDSPERYHNIRQAAADARRALKLGGATSTIAPLLADPGFQKMISVSDPGFLQKIFERFGLREKSVTFEKLAALIKEKRPNDKFLSMLERDAHIPNLVKAAMLASYIDSDSDPKMSEELHKRFGSHIRVRPVHPLLADLERWSHDAVNAKSLEELAQRIREIPPGADLRMIARLWKDAVLPELAERPLGRQHSRVVAALRKDAVKFSIIADHAADKSWNPQWSERLAGNVEVNTKVGPSWCARKFAALNGLLSRRKSFDLTVSRTQ